MCSWAGPERLLGNSVVVAVVAGSGSVVVDHGIVVVVGDAVIVAVVVVAAVVVVVVVVVVVAQAAFARGVGVGVVVGRIGDGGSLDYLNSGKESIPSGSLVVALRHIYK